MIKAWMMKPQAGGLPLTGWSYRKSVTLSRASGAVTDYQMKLSVGESSGATGEDVDCGGLCASDFDDIRFTKSDGTTLLDYWIESITGSTPNQLATIWIEFDSIGTGATTFYMYYGNAGAAAYSSGANTFILFDHFDDGSIDTNKWTIAVGTPTESGSELVVEADRLESKIGYGPSVAYRSRSKYNYVGNTSYHYLQHGFSHAMDCASHQDAAYNNKFATDNAVTAETSSASGVTANTYCILDVLYTATVKYAIDNSIQATHSTYVWSSADVVWIRATDDTAVILTVDWSLIRQYLATEPAWGAWGAQES
jgi:hypothetical protein